MTQARWLRRAALALGAGVLVLGAALAQTGFNEREAKRQPNVQDRPDIWVLDLTFKDPRMITVDVPGRKPQRRLIWYLWYQVANHSGQPRRFIPDFELVTLDQPATYHDQVLPRVQEAIQHLEDPTGMYDIKNSVTIATDPIPPSPPDGPARKVTGVAVWDDTTAEQHLQDTTRFSIFVSGLSNGWSMDDRGVVRRKTLQLNFRRPSGRGPAPDPREIKFMPPAEWLYRASPLRLAVKEEKKVPPPEANEKKNTGDKEGGEKPPAGGGRVDMMDFPPILPGRPPE